MAITAFATGVDLPSGTTGSPRLILTDQGSQLDGVEFRTFCKTLDVSKKHTTPYHPQCDGSG